MTPRLTPRERAVLVAAARGLTVAQTAAELGSEPRTVSAQRRSLIGKLGANGITNAVAIAFERGLLGEAKPAAISPGQLRAFHARIGAVAQALDLDGREAKRRVLAAASARFERTIESAADLTSDEASWAIDHADVVLEAVPA